MPETEKAVNVHWLARVAGFDEELLVYAAYVVYHPATEPPAHTVHTISGQPPAEHLLATFKNADHKVVFQAPAAAVAYVRRADFTGKVDRNAPPGQVADLKAELAGGDLGQAVQAQAGGSLSGAQVKQIVTAVQASLLKQAQQNRALPGYGS